MFLGGRCFCFRCVYFEMFLGYLGIRVRKLLDRGYIGSLDQVYGLGVISLKVVWGDKEDYVN